MATKSTNKWALERARRSANVLLKKAGMEPLLVEVLSDLIWVVDHQQDVIERLLASTTGPAETDDDGELTAEQARAALEEREWIRRKEREV